MCVCVCVGDGVGEQEVCVCGVVCMWEGLVVEYIGSRCTCSGGGDFYIG